MRNIALALPVFLASFISLSAQSEADYELSLKEAENLAARNAYTVQNKALEIAEARQTIRETAAMGLPQISSGFGYTYNAQIPEQPIPAFFFDPNAKEGEFITVAFSQAHTNQANITLNQLIFDASYFIALRATRVLKETKALEKEDAELTARANAAQSYYAVLVAEESYRVARKNYASAQRNFEETRKLYENGFAEKQDADQLQLMTNNLRNSMNNAQRQIELARNMLKFSLGLPLSATLSLTDNIEELVISSQVAEMLSQSEFNHSDHITYRSLLSQERGARLQLSNQKAAYFPKLSGFVQHTQSNFANSFNEAFTFQTYWIPGTSLGLNLSWDLFTGFRRDALVEKAKIDLQKLEVAKNSTANQLQLEYQQALSNFRFALDNYMNQKRNLELSESISKTTKTKYAEGISSSLELTQAENQLLQTQASYFNALLNMLNAKENLETALGKQQSQP